MGIIAFALQIYFDFSGYSDMAIGLGACLGFHFPENFNFPYISKSITEFWRRWHMTLSGWFREYVYIPLGGNKKGIKRQILNIFIVWMLTGIWHGAGWNFLLWGIWFAIWLMIEKLGLLKILTKLPSLITRIYTLFIVLISWVLFSIESIDQIWIYIKSLFMLNGNDFYNEEALFVLLQYFVIFIIGFILSTPVVSSIKNRVVSSDTGIAIGIYQIAEKVKIGRASCRERV